MKHFKKFMSAMVVKPLSYQSYSLPTSSPFSDNSVSYQLLGVTGGLKPYTVTFLINDVDKESSQFNAATDPLDITGTTAVYRIGMQYISLRLTSADGQTVTTPSVRVST